MDSMDPHPGCREGGPLPWLQRGPPGGLLPACRLDSLSGRTEDICVYSQRSSLWTCIVREQQAESWLGFGGLRTAPSVGSPVSAGACARF